MFQPQSVVDIQIKVKILKLNMLKTFIFVRPDKIAQGWINCKSHHKKKSILTKFEIGLGFSLKIKHLKDVTP